MMKTHTQSVREKLIQSGVLHGRDPAPDLTAKRNVEIAKRTLSKVNAILARRALTHH